MSLRPIILAALLLTACGGSLIDHLGFNANPPQNGGGNPDGGNQCTAPRLACAGGCCLPQQIAAGGSTTCAILSDGTVHCWGTQLGGASSSAVPLAVQGLSGVTNVAVGPTHACAVSGGQVLCWGNNDFGELGPGAPAGSSATPVAVAGVSNVSEVTVGSHHSCALTSTPAVLCWGHDDVGQVGDGKNSGSTGVVTVPLTAQPIGPLSAGLDHTCVGTSGGGVACWGKDANGQIGNGTTNAGPVAPATVTMKTSGGGGGGGGTPSAIAVAAGESHSCALTSVNTNVSIQCWGAGIFGQLGDGLGVDESSPTKLAFLGFTQVTGGGTHTCAFSAGSPAVSGEDTTPTARGLYCWGANDKAQLGAGSTSTPVRVPPAAPLFTDPSVTVAALAAGTSHTCALLQDGSLLCWGENSQGQSGTGTAGGLVLSPTQVTTAAP
jgi:alpha-tubulin suppressor-like RCC1 family protein